MGRGGTPTDDLRSSPVARNTLSRSLHDLGLSAWFGGTLANAVALNAAASEAGKDTGRVAQQQGVAGMSALKTLLTAAALGVTAYSRALGQKVNSADNPRARSGTKPAKLTKAEIADAMDQLDRLQWVVPALTGALVVVSSYAGEQQRPSEVIKGIAEKDPTAG